MVSFKMPVIKTAWPPTRWGDELFRYPTSYRVGTERGESFSTIGKKYGVDPVDLVRYNFRTTLNDEINWYLANYVGCPSPKPGQRFITFEGAAYDPLSNKGVIFIPTFGESGNDYLNRFGQKIVENYNKAANKKPQGLCYEATYARVSAAAKQVGITLPSLDQTSEFGRFGARSSNPRTRGSRCQRITGAKVPRRRWCPPGSAPSSIPRGSGPGISSPAPSFKHGRR